MSQGNTWSPTTGTVPGLTLTNNYNGGFQALQSMNSGATAPVNDISAASVEGQQWLDTSTAGKARVKLYDGTSWLVTGVMDVTNHIWQPVVGGGAATLPSAATTDLGSVDPAAVTISGTTTITSFGSSAVTGQLKFLTFSGALTLTQNATSLILPTAANISTSAGDTSTAKYEGSGNWRVTQYQRASGAALVATLSTIPFSVGMHNGTIVPSVAANAVTFAIKTLAGADPSAGDPVLMAFRSATASSGSYNLRTITGPLSITIPSGQAIGFLSATPGRVWLQGLDNAGTVELAVINCVSMAAGAGVGTNVSGIYPLQGWGIISTSAVSGASAAQTAYSTTARSNVPYIPLGYVSWETGGTLATAGTWATGPTRTQIYQPGSVPLPGTRIQRQRLLTGTAATGTTAFAAANTIPQNTAGDQYMSQAITPISSANVIDIRVQALLSNSIANNMGMGLFQDTTANAVAVSWGRMDVGTGMEMVPLFHSMLASTLSSTTFKIRAGGTSGGTMSFNAGLTASPIGGGVANSYLQIEEIQG